MRQTKKKTDCSGYIERFAGEYLSFDVKNNDRFLKNVKKSKLILIVSKYLCEKINFTWKSLTCRQQQRAIEKLPSMCNLYLRFDHVTRRTRRTRYSNGSSWPASVTRPVLWFRQKRTCTRCTSARRPTKLPDPTSWSVHCYWRSFWWIVSGQRYRDARIAVVVIMVSSKFFFFQTKSSKRFEMSNRSVKKFFEPCRTDDNNNIITYVRNRGS